jgi:hypothetical protein
LNHIPPESPKGDLGEDLPAELDTPEFRTAWTDWEAYRREIRKKLTPSTRRKQLAKCAALGVERAVLAIDTAIERGWIGFYERDERTNRNGKHTRPSPGQRHREPDYEQPGSL